MQMESVETESLYPDGETIRKVKLTREGEQIRIEVLEGPPLRGLSPLIPLDEKLAADAWEDYIAHKWSVLEDLGNKLGDHPSPHKRTWEQ